MTKRVCISTALLAFAAAVPAASARDLSVGDPAPKLEVQVRTSRHGSPSDHVLARLSWRTFPDLPGLVKIVNGWEADVDLKVIPESAHDELKAAWLKRLDVKDSVEIDETMWPRLINAPDPKRETARR